MEVVSKQAQVKYGEMKPTRIVTQGRCAFLEVGKSDVVQANDFVCQHTTREASKQNEMTIHLTLLNSRERFEFIVSIKALK